MALSRNEDNKLSTSIWSIEELTVLKYTNKQAHEQAAMVYRTVTGSNRKFVFPPGTYNSFDTTPVFTAEMFSRAVQHIADELIYQHYCR